MLLFRSKYLLDTQSKPLCKSQHTSSKVFAYFWVKSPAITHGFRRVVKGGFYRSFDLNLNIKKGNVVYFTLTVFLFLVSLAILDSYPTYHQENAGKNISKRHFFHVNRIM